MTQVKTVVIVGAGLAGLRAASVLLKKRGIKLILLEGRDRIGGRAYTASHHALSSTAALSCSSSSSSPSPASSAALASAWHSPLDLGCAWIHGTTENPLTPIARAVGAQYYELSSSALWDNGKWLDGETAGHLFDVVFALGPKAVSYSKESRSSIDPERSFYDYCLECIDADSSLSAQDKVRAKKLAHFYTNITAEEVTKQSLRNYLLEEELPGASPMVASTYAPIVQYIARPAQEAGIIELHEKVYRISTSSSTPKDGGNVDNQGDGSGGVQVFTRHVETGLERVLSADAVLVTVPLGVLKASSIHFEPGLPRRVSEAIDSLGMGSAEKLFIKFKSAFWLNNHCMTHDEKSTVQEAKDMYAFLPQRGDEQLIEFISLAQFPINAQPVLLCYSAANVAHHIASLWHSGGKDAVLRYVMPYISRIPGYDASESDCQVEDLFSTDWSSDEFSYGSYSFSPIGSMDTAADCDVLARGCPEQNLFFAGEHAASEQSNFEIGTAHGAYSSGEHAASLILGHLGKQG